MRNRRGLLNVHSYIRNKPTVSNTPKSSVSAAVQKAINAKSWTTLMFPFPPLGPAQPVTVQTHTVKGGANKCVSQSGKVMNYGTSRCEQDGGSWKWVKNLVPIPSWQQSRERRRKEKERDDKRKNYRDRDKNYSTELSSACTF